MSNILSIRINIAERFYLLKVKPDEEEKIRQAAKKISDKLLSLKEAPSGKDAQDLLAMACLWFALKLVDIEDTSKLDIAIKGIQNLEQHIAEYMEYSA